VAVYQLAIKALDLMKK